MQERLAPMVLFDPPPIEDVGDPKKGFSEKPILLQNPPAIEEQWDFPSTLLQSPLNMDAECEVDIRLRHPFPIIE